MKSENIKKIIEEYVEEPNYIFGKYKLKALCDIIEEEEKDLSEDKLRTALENCEFEDPNIISIKATLLPVLCGKVVPYGKWMRIFDYLYSAITISVITLCIITKTLDNSLIMIGIAGAINGLLFLSYTRDHNVATLIYQVLKLKLDS